jgi:hypothetical protein
MSQRTIDTAATEIMVMETKAMIDATKKLFYALQVNILQIFLMQTRLPFRSRCQFILWSKRSRDKWKEVKKKVKSTGY